MMIEACCTRTPTRSTFCVDNCCEALEFAAAVLHEYRLEPRKYEYAEYIIHNNPGSPYHPHFDDPADWC